MNASAAPDTLAARLGRTLQSLGWVDGLLYLIDRTLRRASGGRVRLIKYRLVAQPLGMASTLPMRGSGSTRVELAGPDHRHAGTFPRPPWVIAMRYRNGARCLVATVKDQFAGYLWWQREHYDEDEVRCRFVLSDAAVSAWDFDVYVEPRYRLGRTMALLWQAAEGQLMSEGVRWSFSRISAFNAESLTSHARLGAVVCATAHFLVVGRLQVSLIGQPPFLHLSLSDASRPLLRLAPPAAKSA